MRWQLRLKSYFSEDQTLFLKPGRGTVHVFCEHLSPGDDSACNPRPTSLRQAKKNPLNAGRNDLANLSLPKMSSGANAFEISDFQEDETAACLARRSQCNNVALR
jgi:hypothetical protein